MKKVILVLLCLALFVPMAFANKGKDEKIKIVLVHGYADFYQRAWTEWEAEHPEAELVWVPKGGGVVASDALIAAKVPPNVFMATPGEVGKYLIPGFALKLDDYVDLSDFLPGSLDIYNREGGTYAIPVTVAVNAFDINLTLAEAVGIDTSEYRNRDYLSIEEFTQFCMAIRDKAPEGYYGTAIWAGNLGSQQVNWHWLSAFGATFFENGDYSKVTINSPEAVQGMEYMKFLVDSGFAPPEAPVLDDDEAIAIWASGKIGGLWARAGGWLSMIDSALSQGMSDSGERQEHVFQTWPVADGVEKNPLSYGGMAGLVIATGDEQIDALAADLLDHFTDRSAQTKTIAPGAGYVTRYSAIEPPQDVWPEWTDVTYGPDGTGGILGQYEAALDYDPGFKHYTRISELWNEYGGLDVGISTIYFEALKQEWLKVFQPFMTGDITAEEALSTLEREMNKILAGN